MRIDLARFKNPEDVLAALLNDQQSGEKTLARIYQGEKLRIELINSEKFSKKDRRLLKGYLEYALGGTLPEMNPIYRVMCLMDYALARYRDEGRDMKPADLEIENWLRGRGYIK